MSPKIKKNNLKTDKKNFKTAAFGGPQHCVAGCSARVHVHTHTRQSFEERVELDTVVSVYRYEGIDMRIDMRIDMPIDMPIDMRIDMRIDKICV